MDIVEFAIKSPQDLATFNHVELIQTQVIWIKDITPKIKKKEEEVNVSRKRHPYSKHLLPALQAAPEHPHETMLSPACSQGMFKVGYTSPIIDIWVFLYHPPTQNTGL